MDKPLTPADFGARPDASAAYNTPRTSAALVRDRAKAIEAETRDLLHRATGIDDVIAQTMQATADINDRWSAAQSQAMINKALGGEG